MDIKDQSRNQSRDDRLAEVLEGYLASAESGSPPSRTLLLEKHPDLAEDLVACLDTLDFIGHSLGHGPATAVLECGQQFGDYQILREIGRGGMGVVYEAFHLGLERQVALKVLSGRSFEDDSHRERFLQEAKTAAGLHHTNIVPIFEVGELDGVCYYAMQFIAGQSLGSIVRELRASVRTPVRRETTIFPPGTVVQDQRVQSFSIDEDATPTESTDSSRRTPPAAARRAVAAPVPRRAASIGCTPLAIGPVADDYFREVARLIAQAADALADAHAHNIVHRDIKPSNLIVDLEGRVWITDFGLAFRADDPAHKGSGDAVGTPAYMSPEQVKPGFAVVDFRTDIYSLGATLYELLTLRPLFEGESSLSILTQIVASEPAAVAKHNPYVPKDLGAIVQKAIAKRPECRYAAVSDAADDLRRFLSFEPIRARHVGLIERLKLWCRREPMLAGVTSAAATLLVLVSIVSHWAILRARDRAVGARHIAEVRLVRAKTAEASAQSNLWDARFQQARATRLSIGTGRRWRALELIAQAKDGKPDEHEHPDPIAELRDEAIAALAIADARLHTRIEMDDPIEYLAFCPTGLRLACGTNKGTLKFIDLETGAPLVVLAEGAQEVQTVAFSPCGRLLAMASRDGAIAMWDVESKQLIGSVEADESRQRWSLIFLTDPTRLVALSSEFGTCRQWEMGVDGARELPVQRLSRSRLSVPGPDAQSITLLTMTGGGPSAVGELEIWNLSSGERRKFTEGLTLRGGAANMVWDPAGKVLAVGRTGTVDLFVPGESHPVQTLAGHRGFVRAMAFDGTGRVFAASGSFDPTLKLWDARTGDLIAALNEPQSGARTASFSHDGRFVAAGGSEKTVWIWELVSPKSRRQLAAHEAVVNRVAITPDLKRLISGARDGSILIWPLDDADEEPSELVVKSEDSDSSMNDKSVYGLSISSDSRLLAVRTRFNTIRIFDLESNAEVGSLRNRSAWGGRAEFLPGTHDLVRAQDKMIQRWTVGDAAQPETFAETTRPITAVAMSRDGRLVAASTFENRIEVFEIATGKPACGPIQLPNAPATMSLSSDGKLLAAGDRSGWVQLIELPSGERVKSWRESDDQIASVSFSADKRWLAVACRDGTIRLRDVWTGEPLARLPGHVGGVLGLAFGADSVTLATCGEDKLVQLWRLDSLNKELAELGLNW